MSKLSFSIILEKMYFFTFIQLGATQCLLSQQQKSINYKRLVDDTDLQPPCSEGKKWKKKCAAF